MMDNSNFKGAQRSSVELVDISEYMNKLQNIASIIALELDNISEYNPAEMVGILEYDFCIKIGNENAAIGRLSSYLNRDRRNLLSKQEIDALLNKYDNFLKRTHEFGLPDRNIDDYGFYKSARYVEEFFKVALENGKINSESSNWSAVSEFFENTPYDRGSEDLKRNNDFLNDYMKSKRGKNFIFTELTSNCNIL